MTHTGKIVSALLVVAVLVGGAYYWFYLRTGASEQALMQQGPQATTTLPSGSNTSDTALQQDAASIDAQLKGLDSDSTNVDQTVSAHAAAQ